MVMFVYKIYVTQSTELTKKQKKAKKAVVQDHKENWTPKRIFSDFSIVSSYVIIIIITTA